MKKVLITMGILGAMVSSASAYDLEMFKNIKTEKITTADLSVGKFYGKNGVSIESTPLYAYTANTKDVYVGIPYYSLGVVQGGKVNAELGMVHTFSSINSEGTGIDGAFFIGHNIKSFSTDKVIEDVKTSDRITDYVVKAGYEIKISEDLEVSASIGKGIFSNIDIEKTLAVGYKTTTTLITVGLVETDVGYDKKESVIFGFSKSF